MWGWRDIKQRVLSGCETSGVGLEVEKKHQRVHKDSLVVVEMSVGKLKKKKLANESLKLVGGSEASGVTSEVKKKTTSRYELVGEAR